MLKNFLEKLDLIIKLPELKQSGNSFFEITNSNLPKKLFEYQPIYMGKKIYTKTNKIIPSIDFLQQLTAQTTKKIKLNKKEEWLFICGRDIPLRNTTQKGLVLAINQFDECVGYGEIQGKKLKNLFDIGFHLRKNK